MPNESLTSFPFILQVKCHVFCFLVGDPICTYTQPELFVPIRVLGWEGCIIIYRFCMASFFLIQTNSAKYTVFISGSSKSILGKKKLSWHSSLIQWWKLTWLIILATWKTEMDENMPVFCCVKRVLFFYNYNCIFC